MLRSALVVLLVAAVTVIVTAAFIPQHKGPVEPASAGANSSPVLVELFTSEGCSSCPPADKLLADLDRAGEAQGIPVLALGEHVDYWDGLGWKDRFSSHEFTNRQQDVVNRLGLNSPYTPQMVLDGRLEFVGNDGGALRDALTKAARDSKPVSIDLAWENGKLGIQASESSKRSGVVLLAITESNLTTKVERGENGGRVLHHAAVVRRIAKVGELKDTRFSTNVPVVAGSDWNVANLKAVVFVQEQGTGAVLGARAIPFPTGQQ